MWLHEIKHDGYRLMVQRMAQLGATGDRVGRHGSRRNMRCLYLGVRTRATFSSFSHGTDDLSLAAAGVCR